MGSGGVLLRLGDVNGDGRPDLVVASFSNGNVSVLLGNADGSFAAPNTFTRSGYSSGVAIADVNNDGHLDIITANGGPGTVSVLLGNGDGEFQAPINTTLGGNAPNAYSIGAADFNSDSKADLAVRNTANNTVAVLISNGDGHFSELSDIGVISSGEFVRTADLNSDGQTDVVVATGSGQSETLLSNGDGTFSTSTPPNAPLSAYTVSAADLNGDGNPDLIFGGYTSGPTTGTVDVLLGNGNGTFLAPQTFLTGGNQPARPVTGDFNGDGLPDLAASNSHDDSISIFLNTTPDSPTIKLIGTVLHIDGTSHADTVSLSDTGSIVSANINGISSTFQASSISSVVIHTYAGDDSIDLNLVGHAELPIFAGGMNGNDTVASGDNYDDTLHGGDGNDSIQCGTGQDLVIGAAGNDTIMGATTGSDTIAGHGSETILAGDGNDLITDGYGPCSVDAGSGDDTVMAGINADTIVGGDGNDSVHGNGGADSIFGGGGNDTLIAGPGASTLRGNGGSDLLNGDSGNGGVLLLGGPGSDTLIGSGNNNADTLKGGAGGDSLTGGQNDVLIGNDSSDTLGSFV